MPPVSVILPIFVILAIYVIRAVLKAANKGTQQGQGVQNSARQPSNYGRVIHQPSTGQPPQQQPLPQSMTLEQFIEYQMGLAQQRQQQQPPAPQFQQVPPPQNPYPQQPISLERMDTQPRNLEQEAIERMERTRKKQDTFTEEVETSRASHYSEEGIVSQYDQRHQQGLALEHHSHASGQSEAAYNKRNKGNAYERGRSRNSRLAQLIGSSADFKKALLLKEVLERKF